VLARSFPRSILQSRQEKSLRRGTAKLLDTLNNTDRSRDIYYRDPELFRSQTFVDRYVDMIAYTCGVTRFDLNVVSLLLVGRGRLTSLNLTTIQTASPKGLVAGLHDGGEPYSLVPDKSMEGMSQILNEAALATEWKWILVVEKEVVIPTTCTALVLI
jgi:DNA topoisomerase VI subunit A